MIKELHIKNFQSHHDTKLEFSPGVNVIVGRSESGKTAILRALRLLCMNKPNGVGYYSNNTKEKSTIITAVFDKFKVSIEKIISNTKNGKKLKSAIYQIGNEKFESFGVNVPDIVLNSINMSDINWQFQHDRSFLIQETPGEIGKRINEIIDIDKIDKWLHSLNSDIRKNNNEFSFLEKEHKKILQDVKKFDKVGRLKNYLKRIEVNENKIVELSELIETKMEYDNLLLKTEHFESAKKRIKSLHQELIGIINQIKSNNEKISIAEEFLSICEQKQFYVYKLAESKKQLEDINSKLEKCPTCGQLIRKD